MGKIKFTPSNYWSKEDVVLESIRGIRHYPQGKAESTISSHPIIVGQQYYPMFLDVNFVEGTGEGERYIALTQFCINKPNGCGRVLDYKCNSTDNPIYFHPCGPSVTFGSKVTPTPGITPWFSAIRQVRIYPDRKISTLIFMNTAEDKRAFALTKWDEKIAAQCANYARLFFADEADSFEEVTTDEAARLHSVKVTDSIKKFLKRWVYDSRNAFLSVPAHKAFCIEIPKSCGAYKATMTRPVAEKIWEFFNLGAAENTMLLENYFKAASVLCTSKGERKGAFIGQCYLVNFLEFLRVPAEKDKAALAKEATIETRLKEIVEPIKDIWESDKYNGEALWYRSGDDICLAMKYVPSFDSTTTTRYYGPQCFFSKRILAYNVKTKKRFYVEVYKDGSITKPVPSLKYLDSSFSLRGAERMNRETGEYEMMYPRTIFPIGGALKDLFAGSNVAWLLQNVDKGPADEPHFTYPMEIIKHVPSGTGAKRRNYVKIEAPLKDHINANHISELALGMLVTSGDKIPELSLKARLFNIYTAYILSKINGSEVFTEVSHVPTGKPIVGEYIYSSGRIDWYKKGKNLKEIFGHNMKVLRVWNKASAQRFAANGRESFSLGLPLEFETISKQLDSLDENTLYKLFFTPFKERDLYRLRSENVPLMVLTLGKYGTPELKELSIQNKINYCLTYCSGDKPADIKDYLRIRNLLKNKQEILKARGDTRVFYSEKLYPLRPGKSKRFITYVRRMSPIGRPYWTLDSEGEFKSHICEYFQPSFDRGCVEFKTDDEGALLGALVELTPAENMSYLHDTGADLDRALEESGSYYNAAAFSEAVKRVQPLEWEDKKLGLKIIAPKSPKDLQIEGGTLAHCVASYIKPIINGTENIMFLRRVDMPGNPFFTVEILDDGKIRQVHCFHNYDLSMDGQKKAAKESGYECYNKYFDIVQFLKNWAKAKECIDASTIRLHYGALCAIK